MKKGEIYYYFGSGGWDRMYRISSSALSNKWCSVQFFELRKNYVDYFGTGVLSTSYLKENTRKINRRFWYKIIRHLNEDRRNIFN